MVVFTSFGYVAYVAFGSYIIGVLPFVVENLLKLVMAFWNI